MKPQLGLLTVLCAVGLLVVDAPGQSEQRSKNSQTSAAKAQSKPDQGSTARQRDSASSRDKRTPNDGDQKAATARSSQKKSDRTSRGKTLTSKTGDSDTPRRNPSLTAKQRDEAMDFARANHPELVSLVNQLKKRRPAEYQRALRDLYTAGSRFGRLKERLPAKRYEQQLDVWKLDSRIRLQLARWSVSRDPQLEQQIRDALAARKAIQVEQYREDIARTEERLRRVRSSLETLQARNPDTEWKRLAATVDRKGRSNRSRNNKAAQQRDKSRPARAATDRSKTGEKRSDKPESSPSSQKPSSQKKTEDAAAKKTQAGGRSQKKPTPGSN